MVDDVEVVLYDGKTTVGYDTAGLGMAADDLVPVYFYS